MGKCFKKIIQKQNIFYPYLSYTLATLHIMEYIRTLRFNDFMVGTAEKGYVIKDNTTFLTFIFY